MESHDHKIVNHWAEHAAAPFEGQELTEHVQGAIRVALTRAVESVSQIDDYANGVWGSVTVKYQIVDGRIKHEILPRGEDLVVFEVPPCEKGQ